MTMADVLPRMMNGNQHAIAFNNALYAIVELWDDLIDKDPTTPADINGAFYAALITLPRNPFYQQHFATLNPVLEAAILDWFTANELEKQGGEHLRTSYILRCGIHAVTTMCARIIGGVDWANKVNLELRTIGDSWAEYSSEFGVK